MPLYNNQSLYQNPYNSYGNYVNQYSQPQQYNYQSPNYGFNYQQQQIQQPQYPVQNNQSSGINGKVVEGIDIVKTIEIPLGGWAVFPQADGKSIYLKKYLNDGTTQIVTYSPIVEDKEDKNNDVYSNALNEIQKKIEEIDLKVSTLIS